MLWDYIKQKMLENSDRIVSENGIALTYEEVISCAEELAERLDKPCYAVLCRYELHSAIALLACFAAGKTAIPLSHRYGEIHCKRILSSIKPGYMISDVYGELDVTRLDENDYCEPEMHPALIMCTSGTTEIPKGAMISEDNLLCNLADISKYFKNR